MASVYNRRVLFSFKLQTGRNIFSFKAVEMLVSFFKENDIFMYQFPLRKCNSLTVWIWILNYCCNFLVASLKHANLKHFYFRATLTVCLYCISCLPYMKYFFQTVLYVLFYSFTFRQPVSSMAAFLMSIIRSVYSIRFRVWRPSWLPRPFWRR